MSGLDFGHWEGKLKELDATLDASSGIINDDQVAIFDVSHGKTAGGVIFISNQAGLFSWDTVGGYGIAAVGGAVTGNIAFAQTALTGTTGLDGKCTLGIGVSPDSQIYVENRLGGNVSYSIIWFGGR